MPCILSVRDITILYPVGIATIVTIAIYLPSYVKKDRSQASKAAASQEQRNRSGRTSV